MYKDRSIQTNYKLKELIRTVLLSEDDNICLLSGEKVTVWMQLVCASNLLPVALTLLLRQEWLFNYWLSIPVSTFHGVTWHKYHSNDCLGVLP
jgi:hypothetical protein